MKQTVTIFLYNILGKLTEMKKNVSMNTKWILYKRVGEKVLSKKDLSVSFSLIFAAFNNFSAGQLSTESFMR